MSNVIILYVYYNIMKVIGFVIILCAETVMNSIYTDNKQGGYGLHYIPNNNNNIMYCVVVDDLFRSGVANSTHLSFYGYCLVHLIRKIDEISYYFSH